MSKDMLFVFNPTSGKGTIKNHVFSIVDTFTREGWTVTVRPTQRKNDALDFVRENGKKFRMIVVSGGDGTLNETIRGVMTIKEEKRPKIGYIPTGTTNDFASNMKISKKIKKATEDITKGVDFKCDTGMFNDRNFIYVAAFGAFTDVAYETPQQSKNLLGHSAYILEGLKKLPSLKSFHLKVTTMDTEIEDDFIYGMVSNTNYIGGIKAEKAFKAQLNDGLFEVVLIKYPKTVMEAQELVAHLVGQDLSSDAFVVFKTDRVHFHSEEDVHWTLDGEFGGAVKEAEIINDKEAVTLVLKDKL